ncbi:hypothetical protein SAMN03080603_00823 [Acetomicrobium thermoterrenum DSM 13490]|uniref:Uncharacterized protein n=1 Tax=Acetomicrobium thermoterrenum DSM 13490 TaxID=1120987 RepID=A0A1H3EZW4_9BACT|nr:hypothetical protein SAMN03080603_00823 [Acetomicrobium thermoterrenum DSM 13490]
MAEKGEVLLALVDAPHELAHIAPEKAQIKRAQDAHEKHLAGKDHLHGPAALVFDPGVCGMLSCRIFSLGAGERYPCIESN